jgi:hypothetical protein
MLDFPILDCSCVLLFFGHSTGVVLMREALFTPAFTTHAGFLLWKPLYTETHHR